MTSLKDDLNVSLFCRYGKIPVGFHTLDELGLSAAKDVDEGTEVAGFFVIADETLGELLHLGLKAHPVRPGGSIK